MASLTYLITGGNRGIGRGLATALLGRPSTTVIVTVRNPEHETAKSLTTLPKGKDSNLIILRLDQSKDGDNAADVAINHLIEEHPNIGAIDVVIANAGTQTFWGPAVNTPLDELRSHFEVNVLAPQALLQAVFPLLERSKAEPAPKFVAVTSPIASIGVMEEIPFPTTPYGTSKVALNWLTKKVHVENPSLIAFPISPGWVQTEMGNDAAKRQLGSDTAPVSLDDSVKGVLNQIDNATREKTSGRFVAFDGKEFPW